MWKEVTPASALRPNHVSRVFGATAALVQADLEVRTGSVVVLRGGNGAGKSTLLRIIATELSPTYGSGSILGLDLELQRPSIRRRVAFVGHATHLYGDLTVAENLRFWTRLTGTSDIGLTSALERVELEERADEQARNLSQGMRQRLALACATEPANETETHATKV